MDMKARAAVPAEAETQEETSSQAGLDWEAEADADRRALVQRVADLAAISAQLAHQFGELEVDCKMPSAAPADVQANSAEMAAASEASSALDSVARLRKQLNPCEFQALQQRLTAAEARAGQAEARQREAEMELRTAAAQKPVDDIPRARSQLRALTPRQARMSTLTPTGCSVEAVAWTGSSKTCSWRSVSPCRPLAGQGVMSASPLRLRPSVCALQPSPPVAGAGVGTQLAAPPPPAWHQPQASTPHQPVLPAALPVPRSGPTAELAATVSDLGRTQRGSQSLLQPIPGTCQPEPRGGLLSVPALPIAAPWAQPQGVGSVMPPAAPPCFRFTAEDPPSGASTNQGSGGCSPMTAAIVSDGSGKGQVVVNGVVSL
mmetsp:Transcript_45268/g.94226  ORF Transcript_45268/g.94226 Transcript_45268/m.94226 type:complete len:375 (+) Transcript_45268:3-1127(+)